MGVLRKAFPELYKDLVKNLVKEESRKGLNLSTVWAIVNKEKQTVRLEIYTKKETMYLTLTMVYGSPIVDITYEAFGSFGFWRSIAEHPQYKETPRYKNLSRIKAFYKELMRYHGAEMLDPKTYRTLRDQGLQIELNTMYSKLY